MLLYTVPYLIAYSGLLIVIYNARHVSTVQYSYALYSLICEIFEVPLQAALEVFKMVAFLHVAVFSTLQFAICILFIAFRSHCIQVYRSVSQKIMTHSKVIRNKNKINGYKIAGLVR